MRFASGLIGRIFAMTDLAEIEALYKHLRPRRGAPGWRATDELTKPNEAAARRAAFFLSFFRKADQGSRNGRHKRAIAQTFEYMTKKGYRLPDENSLENFIRRSKKRRKTKPAKPDTQN
jgi:hypothetical protein